MIISRSGIGKATALEARARQILVTKGGTKDSNGRDLWKGETPRGTRVLCAAIERTKPNRREKVFVAGISRPSCPPDGGRGRGVTASINIALLTEGGDVSSRRYKHGPPDGGQDVQLNSRDAGTVSYSTPD